MLWFWLCCLSGSRMRWVLSLAHTSAPAWPAGIIWWLSPSLPVFFGYKEKHQITPAAQGGAAGSVRILLTKNPVCSLISCPGCQGSRCLVWTDLTTPTDSWHGIGHIQYVLTAPWGTNTTRRQHRCSPDRTASYTLPAARKPAPMVAGDRRANSAAPGVRPAADVWVDSKPLPLVLRHFLR